MAPILLAKCSNVDMFRNLIRVKQQLKKRKYIVMKRSKRRDCSARQQLPSSGWHERDCMQVCKRISSGPWIFFWNKHNDVFNGFYSRGRPFCTVWKYPAYRTTLSQAYQLILLAVYWAVDKPFVSCMVAHFQIHVVNDNWSVSLVQWRGIF